MTGTWEAEETFEGTYDVFLDRRIVEYDLEDLDAVKRLVRERGGDFFILTEEDGYRTTTRI